MRYLYGDSAPFPHGYDFLATLQRFLEEGAKVARATSEMVALVDARDLAKAKRTRALAELEAAHAALAKEAEDMGLRLGGELAPEYAGQVVGAAVRAMEAARAEAARREDAEQRSLDVELERLHGDARRAVEAFVIHARLPILAATIRMALEGGVPHMSADLVHEGGVVAAVTLDAARVAEWAAPRRAGDLVSDLELRVGVKKGIFRRGDEPEPVRLDDFVVGGFSLGEDTAELRLRRRASEPDAFVFVARLEPGGRLVADVSRPLEGPDHAAPMSLDEADRRKILTLWERLRSAVEGPLDRRRAVDALLLDGEDVFASGRYDDLLARVVRSLAHTMAEVSKRSPNKEELSLKRESAEGSREELYVKKRDLVACLAGLTVEQAAVFAPLGLGAA